MIKEITINGKIDKETEKVFFDAVSSLDGVTQIDIFIDSDGGVVSSGLKIYDKIKDLRRSGIKVNTIAPSSIGSIAESIFLAGEERIMYSSGSAWTHEPTINGMGEDYYRATADELGDIKKKIFDIHRAVATENVTDEDITRALSNETYITPSEYLSKGYATKLIDNTAFADKYPKTINSISMEKTKIDALMDKVTEISAYLFSNKKHANNICLQSVTGEKLEFVNLTDGQSPSVGEQVLIDGSNKGGSFEMEDGSTYVCEKGILKEILPKKNMVEVELSKQIELLMAENKKLSDIVETSKKDLLDLSQRLSLIVTEQNSSFSENAEQNKTITKKELQYKKVIY